MNNSRIRFFLAPALVAGLVVGVAACGDDSDSDGGAVSVTDVWVRQPAEGQPNSAGYGTITNDTGADITLIGASADIQATFEIHETMMGEDGAMSMQQREDGLTIASGESFTLEPGGPHVMMLGIDPADFDSDGFDLTFLFDGADEVTDFAEIRPVEGLAEMEDSEMEMDSDE